MRKVELLPNRDFEVGYGPDKVPNCGIGSGDWFEKELGAGSLSIVNKIRRYQKSIIAPSYSYPLIVKDNH